MPITFVVDHAKGVVRTTATGPMSYADVRAHIAQEDASGALSYRELIDARAAVPTFSPDEVRAIVHHMRDLGHGGQLGATAIVTSTSYAYGMFRMLELLMDDVCDVVPFRDMPDAEAWLDAAP